MNYSKIGHLLFLVCLLVGCADGGIGGTGGTVLPSAATGAAPASTSVGGYANKGPFATESSFDVFAMQADGTVGDDLTSGTTLSLGEYQFSVEGSEQILIEVSGRYFSELAAEFTSAPLTLRAVGEVGDMVNVNVATHLIEQRIRQLMMEGNSLTAASDMARSELLMSLADVLPVPTGALEPTLLVVINASVDAPNAEGNAWLLALSSILDAAASGMTDIAAQEAMSNLLEGLAIDLADDGLLSPASLQPLLDARAGIDPNAVHSGLLALSNQLLTTELSTLGSSDAETQASSCSVIDDEIVCVENAVVDEPVSDLENISLPLEDIVADMNRFLDSDGDGEPNAIDLDDDNDGINDIEDESPYVADR